MAPEPTPNTLEDVEDLKAIRDHMEVPATLLLYTADGHSVSLENFYRGRRAFLVMPGPSLGKLDLTPLKLKPGILTMGVNNVWVHFRPNLWTCVDDPGHFVDTGWKDPSILKLVPSGKLNKQLHVKQPDGSFKASAFRVTQMPACLFFRRNERFQAETFLTEGTVNWGTHGKHTDHLGIKGSRTVMLSAVRLLYYLGIRTIYLLGVDFKMVDGEKNYVFTQFRYDKSVKGNTDSYAALTKRFQALIPYFKAAGLQIFNCNPDSGLKVFPHKPYEQAVAEATRECSKEVDTEGWYDHDKTMKGRLDEAAGR